MYMFNIVKEREIFYSVSFAETISYADLQIAKLLQNQYFRVKIILKLFYNYIKKYL